MNTIGGNSSLRSSSWDFEGWGFARVDSGIVAHKVIKRLRRVRKIGCGAACCLVLCFEEAAHLNG